jgi:hypothetical protein
VLEEYDSDKLFPVFGFGGIPIYAGAKETSHCFNLSGIPNPEVQGVAGIFNSYKAAVLGTTLSGPTYFGPIL